MTTKEEIIKIEELLAEAYPPLRTIEKYALTTYLESLRERK